MKRRFLVLCCLILLIASPQLLTVAEASGGRPLDEIQSYYITLHAREDGTLDIKYEITWKVLRDSDEGLLTWVKIGCPNRHVDTLEPLSDTIKSIRYMGESGNSYIRVDFKKSYRAGDTVRFSYSIHQSYICTADEERGLCVYNFTPGWFEEINVKAYQIRWDAYGAVDSNADFEKGDYLVWSGEMKAGDHVRTTISYDLSTFTIDPDQQYVEGDDGGVSLGTVLAVVFVILALAIIVAIVLSDDGYGVGGGGIFISGGGGCACASSCACACACAGGGRAGCSAKDFYYTNLRREDLQKALKPAEPAKTDLS